MAVTWQQLMESTPLPNAAATQFTSPVKTTTLITKVTLTNVDTVPHAVTIYVVPFGGTAGTGNIVVDALSVPPKTVNGGALEVFVLEGQQLQPGDFVSAFADTANDVNMFASGAWQV